MDGNGYEKAFCGYLDSFYFIILTTETCLFVFAFDLVYLDYLLI